jgi:hypothetical protein
MIEIHEMYMRDVVDTKTAERRYEGFARVMLELAREVEDNG